MDEGIVKGTVGDPQPGGVPLDSAARAERDVAKEDELGQLGGIIKVRTRGFSRLAGLDPLGMVAGRAQERGLGLGIAGKLAFGKQPKSHQPRHLNGWYAG